MSLYRRHLPHVYQTNRSVFLTWRLHLTLPLHRAFPTATLTSGQAFVTMDRLLDDIREGPTYLQQPAIADMVVEALEYNAARLGHYTSHAYAVMPNHDHLLGSPAGLATRLPEPACSSNRRV